MTSDLILADLALASYDLPATIETADIHALIRDVDGITYVSPRGTNPHHLIDLMRDAGAGVTRADPILGDADETLLADAEQLAWRILPRIKGAWAGGAHSKGAAELLYLAAIMAYLGRPPLRIAAFEPPRVGLLGGLVDPAWCALYRHGEDPITELPPWRVHPLPLTALAWVGPRPLDPLDYHAMAGVRAAVAARETMV